MGFLRDLFNFKKQNSLGSVLIIVAVGIVAFCGVAAIVIDVSRVYLETARIEESVEASAMAASRELVKYRVGTSPLSSTQETAIKNVAIAFAAKNGVTITPGEISIAGNRVYINGTKKVEYTFAKVIGFDSQEVQASKAVEADSSGKPTVIKQAQYHVMPWAMPHRELNLPYDPTSHIINMTPSGSYEQVQAFTVGQEYVLKLGNGISSGDAAVPLGTQIIIPMGSDETGINDQWSIGFKRSYGLALWLLTPESRGGAGVERVQWLLGYRGGSFMFDYNPNVMVRLGALKTSGSGLFGSAGIFTAEYDSITGNYLYPWVKYWVVTDASTIIQQTTAVINLTTAPRIGVYSSGADAVTRTLDDAGIPYENFYDTEVTNNILTNPTTDPTRPFTWLHLHHEDFTQNVGESGQTPVPWISIWDTGASDGLQTGPCSLLYVRGWNWMGGGSTNNYVRIYFGDQILSPTLTATYSGCSLSTDAAGNPVVRSNDQGSFEVYITVPQKPNGKYFVYARGGTSASDGGDATSNYLTYNVIGSTLAPSITAINNETLNQNVSTNNVIKVTGSNFGAYQKDIIIKFDGMGQDVSKTMTYVNCNVTNSLVTADGSGNFEVTFYTPDVPDGTHEVYAQFEQLLSNKIIFNVNNYRTPAISINDYIGIPDAGPKGSYLFVSGTGFVPNYTGITVKFNNSTVNAEDTSYYSDDFVFGGLISSNPDGKFQIRFTVPESTVDGTYEVKAFAGGSSSTEVKVYNVRNSTTAEIAIYDLIGDATSGPSGTEIVCRGVYFTPMISNIKLKMGTTELEVIDTPTYSADYVYPPDYKLIKSDYEGKFEVKFTIPADAPGGIYDIQAYVGDSPISNIAKYTVSNFNPTLTFTDTAVPYNAGPSNEVVRVSGSGFTPGSSNIKVYFNSAVQNLTLPGDYSGSATISGGQNITVDSNGSFEVQFTTPIINTGIYNIIAFNGTQSSPTYTYNLSAVSTYITSSNTDCSTNDDAFNRNGMMYLKVLNNGLDRYNITSAYFTVQCNYHTSSPHVSSQIALTNNGDFSYTGSFNWASYANVHNGTWQINFYIRDGNNVIYNPSKTINITGTNVSTESYIVSAMPNLSSSAYAFNDSSTKMYYKIQSHIVDCANITDKTAKIYCAKEKNDGSGHLVNFTDLTNNLDGTYNGWKDTGALSPACHLGLWYMDMKIRDSFYATYNPVQEFCVFSTTTEVRAILSRNNYFSEGVDYKTDGTSSTTTYTFNSNGKVHIMINTKPANINVGNITTANFCLQFASSNSNLGSFTGNPVKTVVSPNYNLTNLGNGCFSGEVMLNAVGNNKRVTDVKFRVRYRIIDSANTQIDGYTGKQSIDMANGQTSYGITMNERGGCPHCGSFREQRIHTCEYPFPSFNLMAGAVKAVWGARDIISMKVYNAFESARWSSIMAVSGNRRNMIDRASEIELAAFMSRNANQAKNRFGDESMERDVKLLSDPRGLDIYNRFRVADVTKNYKHHYLPAEQGRKDYDDKLASGKQNAMASNSNKKSSLIGDLISSAIIPSEANAAAYSGKYTVVNKIRDWVLAGGYMFTMCYATETIDRTLCRDAAGTRYTNTDGTYDYTKCFAFTGFDPSATNGATGAINGNSTSNFNIVNQDLTADKYKRPLAVIQNHKFALPGYSGATDSFAAAYVKSVTGPKNSPVNILARISDTQIKYIAAEYGDGWFSFLAGHDPRLVETYRLILDNIMIGSLSPNNPPTGSYMSYGIIDWDNTDDGYDTDKSEYTSTMSYGRPPSLFGAVSTTYPGDIAGDQLVDSLPYCYEDATYSGITALYSADAYTPISSGNPKRSYLDYADGSSRFVLIPIVSTFKSNGTLACTQATNVANTPAFIYKLIGRDKVRIKGYGLFYLSDNVAHADADPVYNEVGATTYGEVRGKFVGYLK